MDTIIFLLYTIIFICIWYVFNQYFKDHSKEVRQPIRVNVPQNIQRWKEHFLGGENKLSIHNIKNMVKKAMNQISNDETDLAKPKVEEMKTIDTDMELYLIGPDKEAFFKNLQEGRKKPTLIETNKGNLDIESYFGTNKIDNHSIMKLL